MALTRVLITVKTYPTISSSYDELVCTAGFLESGVWIRIYPIPFRKKTYEQQYRKYDWIELDLVKNTKDFRPESFRPHSEDDEIKVVGHIDTQNDWAERKNIVLQKVYTNLTTLIAEAKDRTVCTSLAVFKPKEILEFVVEEVEREWDEKKLASMRQTNLFDNETNGEFEVVKKLPYKFSYRFIDEDNRESTLMIEDWEIGALYWRQLAKHEGNEEQAIADVRQKYFDDFAKTKDLYLFLGTTQKYHSIAPNPFIIVGTFHPKKTQQDTLF